MIRWLLLALLLSLLQAPAAFATSGGGSIFSSQSGVSGIHTGQVRISDHPHHVLMGHIIIVSQGGRTIRALVIQQRHDGVHRLRFRAAWSDGISLPFNTLPGSAPACPHGHCSDRPVGLIFLSAPLFDLAQRQGLTARLTGPSGAIDISVPPRLFRDAATRARAD